MTAIEELVVGRNQAFLLLLKTFLVILLELPVQFCNDDCYILYC